MGAKIGLTDFRNFLSKNDFPALKAGDTEIPIFVT